MGRLEHLVAPGGHQGVPHNQVRLGAADYVAAVGRKAALAAALDIASLRLPDAQPPRAGTGLLQICLEAPVERVEQEVAVAARPEEQVLPVVGELELRPASKGGLRVGRPASFRDVKDGKGGLFVVAVVVQQDAPAGRRRDGKDVA